MTWYLLVLLSTVITSGYPTVGQPIIVAKYADPYDCEAMRATLTGSTLEHEYVVCVPAQEHKK